MRYLCTQGLVMKSSSISEIKKALKELEKEQLAEMLLKLARLKKENKTYLDYWLFEEHDKERYLNEVKETVSEEFKHVNPTPLFAKKTLRKIIKLIKSAAKLLHDPEHEIDLWLHYCKEFHRLRFSKKVLPPVILNLYKNPFMRIQKLLPLVHEDLQFDFNKALEQLPVR